MISKQCYAKGKSVLIARVSHPDWRKPLRLTVYLDGTIKDFEGVSIGQRLSIRGTKTSPITEITSRKVPGSKMKVYLCKTKGGIFYEIFAL